ncbi:hypothetical protein DBR43_31700 [Pedobacter sp. KBW06]|uniref:SMEK domain-containing protein n=1 Tax=Pedobacter sp. KBW06 TaxID=2153359 RepID=UPI000F5A6CC7|nr:SMEK domain-containing protein [Pedobacter sp. KBW06]RQO64846.1 hypothetical protein DBR43_31700 [Pedobacter sp. KBW06]
MGNSEPDFYELRKYLAAWVTDVGLANQSGYMDINRISERTAMVLLNQVYDLQLQDLNKLKLNHPGVDLGDLHKGIAFQITSENTSSKIISSLETFRRNKLHERFGKGIRFFIISSDKKRKIHSVRFAEFRELFNPQTDILYPSDLQKNVEGLYHSDRPKFEKILDFLRDEFGGRSKQGIINKTLISFNSAEDKFAFYKRVISGSHQSATDRFIEFSCKIGDMEVSTTELDQHLQSSASMLILGPSGCGKSILAAQMAINFLQSGISVTLQGKYYERNLEALLEKEATAFGFDSVMDLFDAAQVLNVPMLIIIDGYNECLPEKRAKLIAELEKVKVEKNCKMLITAQLDDPLFAPFDALLVKVDFPPPLTKIKIAGAYSGKPENPKLVSLLAMVSTALEARMIGEIGAEQIEGLSRFSLFEAFISRKLGKNRRDGFLLLASTAKLLSDAISFSIYERKLDGVLRETALAVTVYEACLNAGLLEKKMAKVTFGHEMFYDFFVAESVVRFASGASEINEAIRAPKNHDKKLLIIGSIDDQEVLVEVLNGLTDVNLLLSLAFGEGGEFCCNWLDWKISDLLSKVEQEVDHLEFAMDENSLSGVNFVDSTLRSWTDHDRALIRVIPSMLSKGRLVKEVFSLVGKLDEKGNSAVQLLKEEAKQKGQSARSGIFASSYVGVAIRGCAMTWIVSCLHSGFSDFYRKQTVPVSLVEELLGKRSLYHGQFYFLLVLLRWDDKLRILYPYVINALTKNWKGLPYHLFNEILDNVTHFTKDDQQRKSLIDQLNAIHADTQDIWKSTMLFDALSALGALEDDATAYIPVVREEMELLFDDPDLEENWTWASNFYDRQFDHPYDYAYQVVIEDMEEPKKKLFYEMALKGTNRSFFASSILIDTTLHMQEKVCPLIEKWLDQPIYDKTTPQDSIKIFLFTNLICSKYCFPVLSRFKEASDPLDQSLFAAGELYYWLNRPDLSQKEKRDASAPSTKVLFSSNNEYLIDSIQESRHNLPGYDTNRLWGDSSIVHIEDFFPGECLKACYATLQNLGWQKEVLGFQRGGADVDRHAIYMLERLGGMLDIVLLRGITDHPLLGESAVEAIKKLSRD